MCKCYIITFKKLLQIRITENTFLIKRIRKVAYPAQNYSKIYFNYKSVGTHMLLRYKIQFQNSHIKLSIGTSPRQ
jgi:hypothetical protein